MSYWTHSPADDVPMLYPPNMGGMGGVCAVETSAGGVGQLSRCRGLAFDDESRIVYLTVRGRGVGQGGRQAGYALEGSFSAV